MNTFIILDDGFDFGVFLGGHGFGADDAGASVEGGFECVLLYFFNLDLFFSLLIGLLIKILFGFLGKDLVVFIVGWGSTAFGTHEIVFLVV